MYQVFFLHDISLAFSLNNSKNILAYHDSSTFRHCICIEIEANVDSLVWKMSDMDNLMMGVGFLNVQLN